MLKGLKAVYAYSDIQISQVQGLLQVFHGMLGYGTLCNNITQ